MLVNENIVIEKFNKNRIFLKQETQNIDDYDWITLSYCITSS